MVRKGKPDLVGAFEKPMFFPTSLGMKGQTLLLSALLREGRIANGAAPYRSAKPPTPQKCSGSCSERCRPETGCSGKCSGKCSSSLFLEETQGGRALSRALPRAPRFWPAPLRALSRALLWGWGFCTSVGGRPVRKGRTRPL